VQSKSRRILEEQEGSILENALLESYIGFSKVFKLLITLKKPIIAHNAFLDFMFLHQQFYKPLPSMYSVTITNLFFKFFIHNIHDRNENYVAINIDNVFFCRKIY